MLPAPRQTLAGPAVAAPMPLTVIAGHGTETLSPAKARYRFGKIGPSASVRHLFFLHNTGTSSVTLDQLMPSCPCVHAELIAPADASRSSSIRLPFPTPLPQPYTLAPGQQVAVAVTLIPMDHGTITKSVWVFVQGRAAPALRLVLTGTIRSH